MAEKSTASRLVTSYRWHSALSLRASRFRSLRSRSRDPGIPEIVENRQQDPVDVPQLEISRLRPVKVRPVEAGTFECSNAWSLRFRPRFSVSAFFGFEITRVLGSWMVIVCEFWNQSMRWLWRKKEHRRPLAQPGFTWRVLLGKALLLSFLLMVLSYVDVVLWFW